VHIEFLLLQYTTGIVDASYTICTHQETLSHLFGECKTNTIPILMHQMRISTNQVSSVVLRPKTLKIQKIVKTVNEPKKPNTVP
jgi:hypothetical protein